MNDDQKTKIVQLAPLRISVVRVLKDNYVWIMECDNNIVVVDPGEAPPVLDYIRREKKHLTAIVLTHDHHDHVGGVAALLAHQQVPVYGACSFATHPVQDSETMYLLNNLRVDMIMTPGHTATSMCYRVEANHEKHLFCGDTLFAAGCGRVFTGDFKAMLTSLNRLKNLDDDVLVYPGHEYTLNNLAFAQWLEPENPAILARIEAESKKMALCHNTLPVKMAIEKKTNPFFRCDDTLFVETVSDKAGKKLNAGLECFIALREMKNNF